MESVFIESLNGKLEGDLYLSNPNKIIILCHGSASNKDKEKNKLTIEKLYESGFSVLGFNFGGSGNSYDTEIDTDKQVQDLRAIVDFVKEKGFKEIGLIGDSLGGFVIFKTYSFIKEDIKIICLWAPVSKARTMKSFFDSHPGSEEQISKNGFYIREKEGKKFKFTPKFIKDRENFDRTKLLSQIDCPVLFIHGDKDDTVPMENSQEAVELIGDSELKVINAAPHNFKNYEEEISDMTVNWFKDKF